jgi:hypothetical protein
VRITAQENSATSKITLECDETEVATLAAQFADRGWILDDRRHDDNGAWTLTFCLDLSDRLTAEMEAAVAYSLPGQASTTA